MNDAESIRALLVEDDDEDAAIFRRHLGALRGQRIASTRVSTEAEALSSLAAGTYDLIFLDLNLNGAGSGLDLLKQLKNKQVDTPAIVVTGTGDEARAVTAMKAGAYDYLVKDTLSPDLLERTIRHAQQRHALEVERAGMVKRLEDLSITDELTSLVNRRHLTTKLEEEIQRSMRTGRPFAVLMVDLDHFKRINDQYGHQAGDQVLKRCAAILQQKERRTDVVARYGGEEFCLILPEASVAGARSAAERLRRAIKASPDTLPTVSIGVAMWEPGSSAEEVLRRADEALYAAKEAGRDRVAVCGDSEKGTTATGW
jgi:diguanylate cyclase (GGDEF)-like protein